MEMVDLVIAIIRVSGKTMRSVNTFFQRLDLGLLVGLEACRPTYWEVWGLQRPRKKGSYILHVSVVGSYLPRLGACIPPQIQIF